MLPAGTRFGPYEILSPLGQGGMGEVYRARDTRLDRTVAIKVLPGHLAHDPQFRERFDREARAVSSLNHPNICVLHDIGSEGGVVYLVMECVEGESLAACLQRGPLPVADALRYAVEVAGALDAAHRRGVIHRDLKPGNIMLAKTGAKLLDFGLAKVRAMAAPAESDHTATMTITTAGSIVGTFQYMSPEQLEGRDADARSDIFAFGATFYEMLTGKRAFTGQSQASLITAIMSAQPAPVSSVQPTIPASLDRVVRRCLAKDPGDRWQTARDLAEELRWIQEGGSQAGLAPAAVAPPKGRALVPWVAAAVCGIAALLLAVVLFRQEKPAPPRPVRFSVSAPEGATLVADMRPMVSPDGESVLFGATAGDQTQLYLHSLASGSARPVPGTEGGPLTVWSFDSRSFLMNMTGRPFARSDVNGGPPQPSQIPSGAYCSWGPAGIVQANGQEVRWFAADGSSKRILRNDEKGAFTYASWLPGGQWLIYNQRAAGTIGSGTSYSVHALSLDGKVDRPLATTAGPAIYAAPGYLLFVRSSVLMAQAIDPKRLELRGGPVPVTDHIGAVSNGTLGAFSVSSNGALAFRPGIGQADSQLMWVDRSGNPLGAVGSPADYSNPALSPDGTHLAVGIRDPATQNRDLWVFDLARKASSRLTFDPADDLNPAWSPDGSRIAFTSDRHGVRNLYVKNASGTGEDELLLESPITSNVEDWSRDGRWIAYNRGAPANAVWVFPLDTRKPQAFLESRFGLDEARFSPDGRWLAYRSLENGRAEVYVRPFQAGSPSGPNGSGGKWQISTNGGSEPQWRADGKELFFISLNPTRIMAVDIAEKNGAIVAGIPHALFAVRVGTQGRNRWLVTPDGKKFLVVEPPEPKAVTGFTVILNWPSLLQK
ncbi:MAG: protein kinase domain-containing protein [Bryobacteraceae bacterium]